MAVSLQGLAYVFIFQGTGIAVGYTGGSLLTAYVAYLSPWMPAWLWMAVGMIMVLGVAITATSSVGAIATLAPKPHAFKLVSGVCVCFYCNT